jgi:hypothetical protein
MLVALWHALPPSSTQFGLLRQGDWLGITLMAVGLAALQTALDDGNVYKWFASPFIVKLSIVAGLAASLVVEMAVDRGARPRSRLDRYSRTQAAGQRIPPIERRLTRSRLTTGRTSLSRRYGGSKDIQEGGHGSDPDRAAEAAVPLKTWIRRRCAARCLPGRSAPRPRSWVTPTALRSSQFRALLLQSLASTGLALRRPDSNDLKAGRTRRTGKARRPGVCWVPKDLKDVN